MRNIIILLLIILSVIAGVWFYLNNNQDVNTVYSTVNTDNVTTVTEGNKKEAAKTDVIEDEKQIGGSINPEKILEEVDQLDESEDEIDEMINELEEIKF